MESSLKCPFCNPPAKNIVAKNDLCYAIWDRFPVSRGHMLVIPFRHTPDFFSLSVEEKQALLALIDVGRELIGENFQTAGYNIGINVGEAAGQTVMHCHCHLIPRYAGDVRDPRGGVRGVVPGKRRECQGGRATTMWYRPPGDSPYREQLHDNITPQAPRCGAFAGPARTSSGVIPSPHACHNNPGSTGARENTGGNAVFGRCRCTLK